MQRGWAKRRTELSRAEQWAQQLKATKQSNEEERMRITLFVISTEHVLGLNPCQLQIAVSQDIKSMFILPDIKSIWYPLLSGLVSASDVITPSLVGH